MCIRDRPQGDPARRRGRRTPAARRRPLVRRQEVTCGGGAKVTRQRPHAATVDALYDIIAGSGSRSLAVIGLVKNAGKTTVVNALMANCAHLFGLTSLGLDGERTDHLTGLAKPRIAPPAGTLVATTTPSLTRGEALPMRLMAPSTSTCSAPCAWSRSMVTRSSASVVGPLTSTWPSLPARPMICLLYTSPSPRD